MYSYINLLFYHIPISLEGGRWLFQCQLAGCPCAESWVPLPGANLRFMIYVHMFISNNYTYTDIIYNI